MTKREAKAQVDKMFEPTIENAIRDMKLSKLLFLTKDNKFYSMIAEEYMKSKEKFLLFIKEEKQQEFMTKYSNVFQEVITQDDKTIKLILINWEHAGDIMMLLSNNTDWDLVDKTIYEQGHSGRTISCLASKVLYFSPYGLDFIEHVYGIEERAIAEKQINATSKLSVAEN